MNVSGRKLLMSDLLRVTESCGFTAPQTLLASGNVVFETDMDPTDAGAVLEAALLDVVGIATDVIVRGAAEIAAIIAANPFEDVARDAPSRLLVMLLKGVSDGDIARLAPPCTQGERVAWGPGCLYIDYPAGVGVSKLTNVALERCLNVRGTARNWNTIGKLTVRLTA